MVLSVATKLLVLVVIMLLLGKSEGGPNYFQSIMVDMFNVHRKKLKLQLFHTDNDLWLSKKKQCQSYHTPYRSCEQCLYVQKWFDKNNKKNRWDNRKMMIEMFRKHLAYIAKGWGRSFKRLKWLALSSQLNSVKCWFRKCQPSLFSTWHSIFCLPYDSVKFTTPSTPSTTMNRAKFLKDTLELFNKHRRNKRIPLLKYSVKNENSYALKFKTMCDARVRHKCLMTLFYQKSFKRSNVKGALVDGLRKIIDDHVRQTWKAHVKWKNKILSRKYNSVSCKVRKCLWRHSVISCWLHKS